MLFLFLSVFTRFWVIQFPYHFVGDEEETLTNINCYINSEYFTPTQPPLATMILAGASYLSQYQGNFYDDTSKIKSERNYTYTTMDYVSIRSISALFATIVPSLSYMIIRCFDGSKIASFLSAIFTLCDFLLISDGRHIFTDGIIHFFVASSVFFTSILSHFESNSFSWLMVFIFQTIFSSFAVSSSFICLSLLLFNVFYLIFHEHSKSHAIISIILHAVIFILTYSAHIHFLSYNSNKSLPTELEKVSFIEKTFLCIKLSFIKLNQQQDKAVDFFKWPFCLSWQILWSNNTKIHSDDTRYVAAFGSPLTWIFSFLTAIDALRRGLLFKKVSKYSFLTALGYILSFLYFSVFPSSRGLCDFGVSVLFGIWTISLLFDEEISEAWAGFLMTSGIIVSVFFFFLWAPYVYGYRDLDFRFTPYFSHI